MMTYRHFVALTPLLLAFSHDAAAAGVSHQPPADPGQTACEFVAGYSAEVERRPAAATGGLHLIAAVPDFEVMGDYLSTQSGAIGGGLRAGGNNLWFNCGGIDVTVTNLGVEAFAEQRASWSGEVSPYRQWVTQTGVGLSDGDEDADGISNLSEYAFGLDPLIADRSVAVVGYGTATIGGERYLTLSYQRDLERSDAVVEVQASPDLADASWSTDSVEDEVISTDGQIEKRLAKIPMSGGRGFMRVVVRLSPG